MASAENGDLRGKRRPPRERRNLPGEPDRFRPGVTSEKGTRLGHECVLHDPRSFLRAFLQSFRDRVVPSIRSILGSIVPQRSGRRPTCTWSPFPSGFHVEHRAPHLPGNGLPPLPHPATCARLSGLIGPCRNHVAPKRQREATTPPSHRTGPQILESSRALSPPTNRVSSTRFAPDSLPTQGERAHLRLRSATRPIGPRRGTGPTA